MPARIVATHAYLPAAVLDNQTICGRFDDLTPESIFRRTGIRQRHVSAPGEIGSDVGQRSAEGLLTERPELRDRIDFLIFCTEYPDHCAPHTAARLQRDLGLNEDCGTLDVTMGCAGFLYGLLQAKGLVETGQAGCVLLITAETPTKVIHPDDRELVQLFGDGGASVVIAESGEGSVGNFVAQFWGGRSTTRRSRTPSTG